jgi:hypothetical protein
MDTWYIAKADSLLRQQEVFQRTTDRTSRQQEVPLSSCRVASDQHVVQVRFVQVRSYAAAVLHARVQRSTVIGRLSCPDVTRAIAPRIRAALCDGSFR